jgi:hypothetical protein
MAEDKYFGIAPENAADAEKQRAKQKRREKMMLEIARRLQHEADGVAKAIESYVGKKEQPLSPLCILDLMHVELDVNALKVYLGVSWLPGEDDEEDDDLDDLPYGWDGPMPWDEEEDDPDTFQERMESLCEKKLTDEDCGKYALFFPIPCTKNMPQVTVKDWLAKFDEEANEWKQEILRHADLDDPIEKLRKFYGKPEIKLNGNANNKFCISEEGADVMTVIASVEEKIGLDADARANAQLHVNQHNKERGRW